MSDLVKRLRQWAESDGGEIWTEAADRIEQLESRNIDKQSRVEELEAELFDLRGVKTQLGAARYENAGLQRKYELLEATLDRIGKLPDSWRNRIILTHAHKCADELRALLKETDDD